MFDDNRLFIPDKVQYIKERRKKPLDDDRCILCELVDGNEDLVNLIVAQYSNIYITLNLYPYNPGHLMIFPERHIEDIRELEDDEVKIIHELTGMSMEILEEKYSPSGFNLGYNMGIYSGASIPHLHRHIVPRYRNELGFLELVSGTRVITDDPRKSREELMEMFEERLK